MEKESARGLYYYDFLEQGFGVQPTNATFPSFNNNNNNNNILSRSCTTAGWNIQLLQQEEEKLVLVGGCRGGFDVVVV
jgi:hypothetical protein